MGGVNRASLPRHPKLTAQEQGALAVAPRQAGSAYPDPKLQVEPRRPGPGTAVTVRSYPIPMIGKLQDHMFVEFDDGRTRLIARGGPQGIPYLSPVTADVTTAEQSRDNGKGQRVISRAFLPDISADVAAAPARRHAEGVRRGGNPYGLNRNSNSYAADVAEGLLGHRVGTALTPGASTRLTERPAQPRSLPPFPGTEAISPPY